jgi:hypothetical protein
LHLYGLFGEVDVDDSRGLLLRRHRSCLA